MTRKRDVHAMVRDAYGNVAKQESSCCSASSCCGNTEAVPPQGDLGLSCGNPVAFAQVRAGDIVVDLGSGAGRDVFLAAEQAGESGHVIGVDMTPEMVDLAKQNFERFRERSGLENVEFRTGQIEDLPVDSNSVDLVISNCVINLSPEKPKVFREVHRTLKPGGRMVVSDIVLNRELPQEIRQHAGLYAACVAGAMQREDYLGAIRAAGFESVEILSEHVYSAEQACIDPITGEWAEELQGVASSISIVAKK